MKTKPILIIGSTGKTGRRIAAQLESQGHAIRHGSRRSDRPFDWQDIGTWAAALSGVRAVYISYHPDLAVPEAPEAIRRLVRMAQHAGVEQLVLLSGRGEPNAQRCETIVAGSGLRTTLLRASWFMQNFSEGPFIGAVHEGVLALPAGEVREPFLDVDDIADVAVAALTDTSGKHDGQLYELTGPQLLSFAEVASTLGEAAGREVRYLPIDFDSFHAALEAEAGPEFATLLTELCREVLDGRNAHLGDGVQRALGREPRDFATYCAAMGESGVWEIPSAPGDPREAGALS